MKSRNRPPLKLTDEDAVAPVEAPDDAAVETEVEQTPIEAETPPEPSLELDPLPAPPPERPISERRRRRMAEEARQAQLRAAAPPPPPQQPAPEDLVAAASEEPPLASPEIVGEPIRRLVEGEATLAFDRQVGLVLEERTGS